MDYSAYSEKNIGRYNGKISGVPWIMPALVSRTILFTLIWLLAVNPSIFIILTLLGSNGIIVLLTFIFYIPLNVTIWILLGNATRSGKDYTLRSALFAHNNNFKYTLQPGRYDSEGVLASVLGAPMTSNKVEGTINDTPFKFFGSYGRGFYVILNVELPNSYPHILLDSRSNDLIVSNLLSRFPQDKELSLEGDFPNYFRVFSAGSPVETLQILSPDLMARMVDYPKKADIEIINNQLHIILNFKSLEEDDVKMLFESARQILKDIGKQSNNSKVSFNSNQRIATN